MLDLSEAAVNLFWQQRQDSVIYRIITNMERVEDWVLDGKENIEEALKEFTTSLNETNTVKEGQEEKIIDLLSHMRVGRALRLMQHLDSIQPGSAAKLLIFAEQASKEGNEVAGFFLNRNLAFERMQLLSRIFSVDRLQLLSKVMDDEAA